MAAEKIAYKTVPWTVDAGYLDDQQLDQVLARYGEEGWQLVAVTPILYQGNTVHLIHHLTRIVEPERKAGFPVGE